jgi:two-component system sensor histidine kinase CpxA
VRIPLYTKVLVWFLLNVAILAAGLWLFFRAQFPGAIDALLLGPASPRIESLGRLLTAEMADNPSSEWPAILARVGDAYGVKLFTLSRGEWIPQPESPLPEPVQNAAQEFPPPRGFPPGGPDFSKNRDFEKVPPPPPRGGPDRQIIRADGSYWIFVNLPPSDSPRGHRRRLLVIQTSSLVGGGLFLDVKPWLAIGAAALGFSLLFWIPLVGGITQTISRLTQATRRIAEGRFDVRVPASRRDELGSLAESINHMTARLDGLVNGQKRFLGDAAHELCSPLARMEVALSILETRVSPEDREALADVQEELRDMARLASELLMFSKASLDTKPVESVALAAIVLAAARKEKAPNVQVDIDDTCLVLGRAELLERAFANLFRNALKHAPGPVTVAARPDGKDLIVTVTDSGPGIPEADLPQIFDPFYRPDSARTREAGGTGLGLSIVKTCVEACGGSVTCRNVAPSGLCILMRLRPAS